MNSDASNIYCIDVLIRFCETNFGHSRTSSGTLCGGAGPCITAFSQQVCVGAGSRYWSAVRHPSDSERHQRMPLILSAPRPDAGMEAAECLHLMNSSAQVLTPAVVQLRPIKSGENCASSEAMPGATEMGKRSREHHVISTSSAYVCLVIVR